uniref:Ata2 protein n=1 Tax=Saccharothrix mutabilis subsp. capreolus TaxID=66854 RepID=Q83W15_STRMP|nr:Ata2 protein [Saccharothrix mutabilis subsp. capreolus]
MTAAPPLTPRFLPERALGWRDGPLDGITCVLRCVEAVLQAHGYGPVDVARCLGGELDLLARDMALEFPGCRLDWRFADDGRDNWDHLIRHVGSGEPVIVMPDLYYYPGSYYERQFHYHDHSVLAVGWDASAEVLTVLDTLGPPEAGYRRELPKSPELVTCCTRMTRVELTRPVDRRPSEVYAGEQIARHTPTVAASARALRRLLEGHQRDGVDGITARAIHLLVLGHVQPLLFLFGSSIGPDAGSSFQRVRKAALHAATRANWFGRALIHGHEQPDPAPHYSTALTVGGGMLDALDQLAAAMTAAGGDDRVPAQRADEADAALHGRLREIVHICYSPPREATL